MAERKTLIRFDDICPTMNWEQWGKAKFQLDKAGTTALLGIIPDCQDPDLQIDEPRPDFWEYIKELQNQGYAIAMHGYQHVFDINAEGIVTKKHPKMNHSEFAGHPYDVQYRKIKAGKEILLQHGIKTDVFFAPAHAYDDNTLKALAANEFKYVSDGKSCKPYKRNGIICLPVQSSGIPQIIFGGNYATAVFHAHEWVRVEKEHAWYRFLYMFSNKYYKIIPFTEYIKQPLGFNFTQRVEEYLCLMWERYARPFINNTLKAFYFFLQVC